jgi:hypothetical protein
MSNKKVYSASLDASDPYDEQWNSNGYVDAGHSYGNITYRADGSYLRVWSAHPNAGEPENLYYTGSNLGNIIVGPLRQHYTDVRTNNVNKRSLFASYFYNFDLDGDETLFEAEGAVVSEELYP